MAQLIFAVPFIGELIAELTAGATVAGEALGLSGATAKALSTLGVGVVTGAVANSTNEFVIDTIGRDKVNDVKKDASQLFAEAMGIYNQDPSAFYNHIKPIDFNKDDVRKHPMGSVITPVEININAPTSPQPVRPNFTTKQIADFTVELASNIAKQGIAGDTKIDKVKAIQETIAKNPEVNAGLAPIISKIVDANLPTNELYQSIASVYNGKTFMMDNGTIKQFYDNVKKLIYFKLVDEIGNTTIMYQTTGPIIPALHGNFLGARSPNNAFPTDLVDLFSAFHDQSYSNGPNIQGDYKYISRLSQNYYRMTQEEQKWARIGILYFSTLGTVISGLVGDNKEDVHVAVNDVPVTNDIYTAVNSNSGSQPSDPIVKYNDRTKFYDELYNDIDQASATSSIMAQSGGFQKEMLAVEFGEIMIELL